MSRARCQARSRARQFSLLNSLLWFTVNITFEAWFVDEIFKVFMQVLVQDSLKTIFQKFKFVIYDLRSTLAQLRPSNFILWNTKKLLFCAERIWALRSTFCLLRQSLGAVALYAMCPAFMRSTPDHHRVEIFNFICFTSTEVLKTLVKYFTLFLSSLRAKIGC
jgi:hypothetical protein